MSSHPDTPPTLTDFEDLAAAALAIIPDELRRHLEGVVIRVSDFADADILADMGLESPFDLLGLYQGVSLDRKSVAATPTDVDMIFLYRRPILEYWFETGHHFGFSDVDMHRIEADTGVSADGTD